MLNLHDEIRDTLDRERRRQKKIYLTLLAALAAVFILSLGFRIIPSVGDPIFQPVEHAKSYMAAVKLLFYKITNSPSYYEQKDWIIQNIYTYTGAMARLKTTFVICLSGMAISLSGAVYQTIFKNPLATPSHLGVSSAISLGYLFLVLEYSAAATSVFLEKYIYCFGISFLILIFVVIIGKLGRASIVELLIVGAAVSGLVGVFVRWKLYYMDNDVLLVYQNVMMGNYMVQGLDYKNLIAFFCVFILGVLPFWLMKASFNLVSFGNDDIKSLGANPGLMRYGGLFFGTLLMVIACMYCGSIGGMALIIPHFTRYFTGADFKKLSLCSMAIGAIVLMICSILSSSIYLLHVRIPLNFIVNILWGPVFVIVLIQQRRGFE